MKKINIVVRFFILVATSSIVFYTCKEEPTKPPPPPPPSSPDTTSHEYRWETFYIGDGYTTLFDVSAVNDSCAWTVGEIYTKDSTGRVNTDDPYRYNAAYWNGKTWVLKKIYLPICTTNNYSVFPIRSTIGYEANDFVFGDGSILCKWNGFDFYRKCLQPDKIDINKLWGPDSRNLYAVGSRGSITKIIDTFYYKMPTNVTQDLTDAFGNQYESWAVGGYSNEYGSVVLLNANTTWVRYDSIFMHNTSNVHSVWCDKKGLTQNGFVAFAGDGVVYRDSLEWKAPPEDMMRGYVGSLRMYLYSVRGSGRNNVFVTGAYGIVLHYNGSTWKFYPELFKYLESLRFTSVSVTTNRVFIVGEYNFQGIAIVGTRIK